MNEIRFDCPQCHRPMEGPAELVGQKVICPDCQEPFFPVPKTEAEKQAAAAALKKMREQARAEARQREALEKIRVQANVFSALGGLFGVLGILVFILALVSIDYTAPTFTWFMAAGALLATGLWLYLIGQVIHIRANTHK